MNSTHRPERRCLRRSLPGGLAPWFAALVAVSLTVVGVVPVRTDAAPLASPASLELHAEVSALALDRSATVLAVAERLTTTQGPCSSVNLIGDSMVAASLATWRAVYSQASIPLNVRAISGHQSTSGPRFVTELRASAGDAPCWVVVLGSNDLHFVWNIENGDDSNEPCNSTPARRAEAARRIRNVASAIGLSDHRVLWVNVHHKGWTDTTCIWNGELAKSELAVADWFGISQDEPGWFLDSVHTNGTGNEARAALTVASL